MKHSLDDMDRESAPLFQSGIVPFTERDRYIRKQFIKTNTEWCEHTYFIQQKRYQINRDNCILLFCKNTNIHTQRRATPFFFEYRNDTVNVNIYPHYYQITIKMTRTVMYTFEQINDVLNSIINEIITRLLRDSLNQDDSRDWRADRGTKAEEVTHPSRSRTPEPMVPHEIVFYDFTCCTIRFPLETELYGMNVTLLSASISPTPMLVYGTTPTDVIDDEKRLHGMLLTTGKGGILTQDDSDVEEIPDDNMSAAGSASPYRSTSVSVKSTLYLFVNVDHNLQSFISTVSVDGGGADVSVSPSRGGHRSSNKNKIIIKTRNSIRKKKTQRNKCSLRRMKRRTYRRAYQTIKKK